VPCALPLARRFAYTTGAALLGGCAADLLPGERVIGVDIAATRWDGAADERFGASVAAGWATAPGVPELRALSDDGGEAVVPEVLALWVGEGGEHLYAAGEGGAWWRDGALQGSTFDGGRWAAGPAGVVVADANGWWLPEQQRGFALRDIAAVALGEERVLATVCNPGCTARSWTFDGAEVLLDLRVGEGGAIAEWQGEVWAGSPDDDAPDGAGQVCNEHGTCIVGEVGDHLGRTIGGGYAAGTFNKWVVPARARIVPLSSDVQRGEVLVLEAGAEDQPLALAGSAGDSGAGDGASLWIGAPYFAQQGQPGGVVYRVDRDASADD
jgi:hypothetical protein